MMNKSGQGGIADTLTKASPSEDVLFMLLRNDLLFNVPRWLHIPSFVIG